MMNNAIDIDAGKDVHRDVTLTNHVGVSADATVIAKAGIAQHVYLLLSSGSFLISQHMQPQDAIDFGRLLIEAGERASWTLVDVAALEAC